MTHAAVCVRIKGRVQGVGYRAWTQDTARALGLSGWVANRPDGSVAAQFEGPAAAVEEMVAALWHGPRFADVRGVEVEATRLLNAEAFEIRR